MGYTIKEKVAQMMLVGIRDKESIFGTINLIKNHHIGGVILYKNCYDSIPEMIELVNKLKEANKGYTIPLTIAIDQEGGRVNRLPGEINNIMSFSRLCQKGENAVADASHVTSSVLRMLGINMNFSPVLDIRTQKDDNAFIGNRAFSDQVELVTKMGELYVSRHLANNVIPVIKHYPGHGHINIDSHVFLPIIRNFKTDRIDIQPFRYLMRRNTPAVMVGHILISNYTKFSPATLSKSFINDFMRKQEKYYGLIVTDELGMKAVRAFYGKYLSVKKAFLAENDIICLKYSPNYVEKCINMIEKQAVYFNYDYHFDKIVEYKQKFHFNDNPVSNQIDINGINAAINKINE